MAAAGDSRVVGAGVERELLVPPGCSCHTPVVVRAAVVVGSRVGEVAVGGAECGEDTESVCGPDRRRSSVPDSAPSPCG